MARCTSGTLEISNCRFDGQFLGENSYNNGGFVGWTDSKVKLTNCLFVPTRITTKYDGCKTFARARNSSDLTLNNCNYTFFYCLGVLCAEWIEEIRGAKRWLATNRAERSKVHD